MLRNAGLTLALLLAAAEAASAEVKIEDVQVYEGMCDASGAIALPEGGFGDRFLMFNSAESILRIYAVGVPDEPPDTVIGPGLSAVSRGGMEVEGATWLDGQAILVGTLGRDDGGRWGETDWQFISVAVEDGEPVAATAGRSEKLLAGLAVLDDDLAAAIGDLTRDDPRLAPDRAGINLEGLSVAADGASLFLGFRNPVPSGRSLLVKLLNPTAVLFENADPHFETPPIRLDLDGRGIRSLEYSPAARAYFIVAGPVGAAGSFDIYTWVEGGSPTPVPGAREALASLREFAPEGLVIDQTGKRLQLFSDNQVCETNTFRSVILTLE